MPADHRTDIIEPDRESELELDWRSIGRRSSAAAGHMDACCDIVQQYEWCSIVGEWDADRFVGSIYVWSVNSSKHDLAGQLAEWAIRLCDWFDRVRSILWDAG